VNHLKKSISRWGVGTQKAHGGFWSGPDRWSPGVLIEHKWENAMTVDQRSWGIRRNIQLEDVLTPEDILTLLVSTVSCGGNMLVNVGPTKEGTIIPIFEERLRQMGTWLKTNGEAIYATVPWTHQNDSLASATPVWYTSGKDSLDGFVYALVIGWPVNGTLTLGSARANPGVTKIEFLGLKGSDLEYNQIEGGLQIQFPQASQVLAECSNCNWVYGLKMSNLEPVFDNYENNIEVDILYMN
jgi:alpha-L-fucosidase